MTMWRRADGLSELHVLRAQIRSINVAVEVALESDKEFKCFDTIGKHLLMRLKDILDNTESRMIEESNKKNIEVNKK